MKKIVLLLVLTFFATIINAQDTIAVFVYSTTKLNEPIDALRSNIEGALKNSAERKYIVLDRTEEFNNVLKKKEYGYQEQGNVSKSQLIRAGNELGAKKICGVVITSYGDEGYFIECKILDIQKNQIDGIARYPNRSGDRLFNLGIASSEKVAISIAEQLNLLSIEQKDQEKRKAEELRIRKEEEQRIREEEQRRKAEEQRIREIEQRREAEEQRVKEAREAEKKRKKEEAERKRAELLNTPFFKEGKNRYIAWSFVGGSYPWGLTTGIESRFGGIMGFGLYADFGVCFTTITVENNSQEFKNITKSMIKYVGGIKLFPYKGLFFGCGFGTISKPTGEAHYDFGYSIDNDEEEIILKDVSTSHGIFFHIGYDFVDNLSADGGLFLGISGGASYDLTNKVYSPSINLKIGYAWGTK